MMDVFNETEDEISASQVTQQDSRTRTKSPLKQERLDSSGPTGVSMFERINFKDGENSQMTQERPDSFVPSCQSMKSGRSMIDPIEFKGVGWTANPSQVNQERPDSTVPSCLSMKSGRSMTEPIEFKDDRWIPDSSVSRPHRKRSEVISGHLALKKQPNLDSIFMLLEENIVTFVKTELKRFKKFLDAKCMEEPKEEDGVMFGEDEEQRSSNREALMKITLAFLRGMKQETLADVLQSQARAVICQRKLKSKLKRNFQYLFEGIAKAGNPTLLNQIYTELYITEGENGHFNDQHEVRQIEAVSHTPASSERKIRCEDIFQLSLERAEQVRTLVTKGVAGIGKSVLTQKYILDWAEDKANKSQHFVFPFTFRELNLLQKRKFSLVELLHHAFPETKEAGIFRFNEFNVVFIFDGLDECRLPLDFHKNEILTDVTKRATVEVLLTNLIRGNLLPTAHLWVTTRPAAASVIPPECIDMVTEVRGFSDPQKEEYFRKKLKDEEQASRVISHIKQSRNLHVMCYIPVFCWISAAVLEDLLKTREREELPKTLTEMYIHFMMVQNQQGNVKYHSSATTDSAWKTNTRKTILTLGKLAFEQLEKGNLIFYEEDLKDCGIDIRAASVYSGLFTEIVKNDPWLNQARVFCFVHLSIQEFLAALYVFLTFINDGVDLLRRRHFPPLQTPVIQKFNFKHLYEAAVDKALQSTNGHLDLFLRFLLGLSLETNQRLLGGLLKKTGIMPKGQEGVALYIKNKIRDSTSPESSINLFHCLNELKDHSLVEEMQQYLRSGSFFKNKLSPSQCSALGFILLSSQENLDEFDLRKFPASEEGLLRLLPVVKASKTTLWSGCNLTSRTCEALASVLTSMNSTLIKLDLSNNDLQDTGVKMLSDGLKSPHCRLEILWLSGCLVTEKGCASLVSALKSNPSYLKELDLSFNHPGDAGMQLLSAELDFQHWKLENLKLDHCGQCRLKPSPLRYFCELSLDPHTANANLLLSENNKGVMLVREKQLCLDHPGRFDIWKQLLCSEGQTGRCYWELKWNGRANIGVTYSGINRRGDGYDRCLGWNDKSWSLFCSPQGYTAWHNNTPTDIAAHPANYSNRVAVYLDWTAGTVSFYCFLSKVSSAKLIHLHTFRSTFTEALYPAFGFGRPLELGPDNKLVPASVYLTQIDE